MSGEEYSLSTLSLNSLNLSDNDLLDKDSTVTPDEHPEHSTHERPSNPTMGPSTSLKVPCKDDITINNGRSTPYDDGAENITDSLSTLNSNTFLPKKTNSKFSQNSSSTQRTTNIPNNFNNNRQHFPNHPTYHFNNHSPPLHNPPTDQALPLIHPATIYSNHHLNEWVSLNVGGRVFTTTKMTLIAQEPDSMLARMFDSDWNHWRDEGGAILIDRSPEYFEPILNYLRTGEVIVDDGFNLKGVAFEAKFYGLSRMVDELTEMMAKKKMMKGGGDDDDAPISRREFLKLIVGTASTCELRCQGVNLEGCDLSRLDLRSINFKFANMRRCNLSFTNLSYCNFERADLSHTVMDHSTMLGCRMLCTNLEAASMKACNFQDAGETHTCLQGANMKMVDLEGSRMAAINLRVANLKNSNLQNCDLRGAILAGTDLENCNLSGCDLQDANLRGANLKGAAFELMLNPVHMSQAVR